MVEQGRGTGKKIMSKERLLTISYPDDLLLSLKEDEETFAAEARLLLAVKLYELGRISTGMAARLANMSRVAFMFIIVAFSSFTDWRRSRRAR